MSYLIKFASPESAPTRDVFLVDPDSPSTDRPNRSRLDLAIEEAQEIVRLANEESETTRREAWNRGYQDGLDKAAEQGAATLSTVDSLNHALRDERDAFFDQIEPQLVKLSIEIAEKILRTELETHPDKITEIVKFAMLQLNDRDSIKLRVNPEDAEIIKSRREEIQDAAGGIRQIEVIGDRRVDRGGCIAEWSNGSLDARIGSQMAVIKRALMEATGEYGDADPGSEQIQQCP